MDFNPKFFQLFNEFYKKKMICISFLIFIQIIILLFETCSAFPSGAPVEACDSLIPRHMDTESLNPKESPYYLVQSSNSYGNNYDGHLKGIKVELGGALFKGFIIVAVNPLTGKRIGNWVKFKGTDVLPCSAITHANSKPKRMASLIWVPEPGTRGYIAFEATVVRSFNEYFVGLGSVLPHQQSLRNNSEQNMPR